MMRPITGKNMATETSYQKRLVGERIAASYLRKSGYEIIAHRYKTRYGEIDLICTLPHKQVLVFVEIKHLKQGAAAIRNMEVITQRQIARNCNAANFFLGNNDIADYSQHSCRFDLVLLSENRILQHIQDAWHFTEEM